MDQHLEKIKSLLLENDFDNDLLKEDIHPSNWVDLLESLPEDENRLMVFAHLPFEKQTEIFPYLNFELQKNLLDQLKKSNVQYILNHLESDDRTTLLEHFPVFIANKYINYLDSDKRREAHTLLGYQEDSIGRLMSTTYVALKENYSVAKSIEYIRKHGYDSDALNLIYVLNQEGNLVGEIPLRKILLTYPEQPIHQIQENIDIVLNVGDSQEVAIQSFKQFDDRVSIPVINDKNEFVGVVTFDDVLHASEEENTEDIQKFGGLEALNEAYVATPFWELIRKRGGWLVILLLGEMLTTTAMSHFEDEIQRVVILSFFVPLIISSGGNSGSQAATLIIRALALGEIHLSSWWKVLKKEFFSGLFLGFGLGAIAFLRVGATHFFSNIYGEHWALIGLTIFCSMIGVVLWGTLSGAMLPFILKKLGADPATSSAPFVATLSDVTGIVIYFTLASWILKGTLM